MTDLQRLDITDWQRLFPLLETNLQEEMAQVAVFMRFPAGAEILHEGQYIKMIPFVMKGLVKVFTSKEDKELLLYYIQANESCIMTFGAGLRNEPSKIAAYTEEDTTLILFPVEQVQKWVRTYPGFNQLFYGQFSTRYNDLVDTISQVVFEKVDTRLFTFLREKARVTGQTTLKISHRQIAQEMGTAREVISRIMKRLEEEGKVKQLPGGIELMI